MKKLRGIYATPRIEVHHVVLEAGIMASSGDSIINKGNTHKASIERQNGWEQDDITVSDWDNATE